VGLAAVGALRLVAGFYANLLEERLLLGINGREASPARIAIRTVRVAGWVFVVLGALLVVAGFAAAFTTVGAVLVLLGAPLALRGVGLASGSLSRFLTILVMLVASIVLGLFLLAGVSKLLEG
jgi:hypothetical protein